MSMSLDKNSIYEIFRACRLCGAGGGYKMPIIPSVVGFDCADMELRQKIRECVQIEVNEDDKMPPLICELCVDKVNDFYEFLAMCRDTNKRTRQRLGLPEPNTQNFSESDNCILGVTEQVYAQDEDDEPLSRRSSGPPPIKIKKEDKRNDKKKEKDRIKGLRKELETLIKDSQLSLSERHLDSSSSRSSRLRSSPTPVRETRQSSTSDKDINLATLKEQPRKTVASKQNLVVKKDKEDVILLDSDDDHDEPLAATKRPQDKMERELKVGPHKKLKLTIKLPPRPPTPPKKSRPGPKCSKIPESPTPKTSKEISRPGPKSSKVTESSTPKIAKEIPRPGPKSSKVLESSDPKISKETPRPGPKSSKSSKRSISPGPKSKRLSSPAPKSKRRSPSPRTSRKPSPPRRAPPPTEHPCSVCSSVFQTSQGYSSHLRVHTVKFTPNELACNPCGEWFTSSEETTAHHKQHRNKNKPYKCRGCRAKYRTLAEYNQHIQDTSCVPWTELPDVKCAECWKEFPTAPLRDAHRCGGTEARPGGKCKKCNRTYQTLKTLKKHESSCSSKKKVSFSPSEVKIAPSVRRRLLPAQVRIARCDQLLSSNYRKRFDVSNIAPDFGLDRNCVYPYRSYVRVKQEPLTFDGMVSINKDITDEFYIEEDYVHWDSDNSNSSDEEYSLVTPTERKKRVPSLTTLSLKTIFSRRCLGKVPRKLRKVRNDKFDSFFNPEAEFDVQDDINNIINNLGDDNDANEGNEGFSVNDIKLTDVKSISDFVDNESENIDGNNGNVETNDVSDSLLEEQHKIVESEEKSDSDSLKISDKINNERNSLSLSNNINNKLDNDSETYTLLDDEVESTKNNYDEKDTASENSQDETRTASNSDILQNGKTVESEIRVEENGKTENQTDLIKEINELYDKKLMDELDAQIGAKDANISEKNDKILLHDLVPNKNDTSLSLDAISDEEFNFDT